MKLLFVESSRGVWGLEQHLITLATGMARRGHEVRVLLREGSLIEPIMRASGLSVHSVHFGGGCDPRVLRLLFRLIADTRPDWLITGDGKFYWPAVILGQLTDIRVALFRHQGVMHKRLTRYFAPRMADHFIVVSEYMVGELVRCGIPRARLRLLHNPIDTDSFQPSAVARLRFRSQLGLSCSDFLVGFVGRIVSGKGVFPLCQAMTEAMRQLAPLHMLWVGDGGELAGIKHSIPLEHVRRHHFMAWTQDIASVYPALDLLVVPSIEPETFGRVSVEAQACGVPVICSNAGGLPETLLPGCSGVLSAPGDAEALCGQIRRLAAETEELRRMGMRGREFVTARYAMSRICEQFELLLCAQNRAVANAFGNSRPDGFI